eukprot:6511772-Pyramimonas_sp.AAC.1
MVLCFFFSASGEGKGTAVVGSCGVGALETPAKAFKVEFCDAEAPRDKLRPLDPTEFNLERSQPRSIQG